MKIFKGVKYNKDIFLSIYSLMVCNNLLQEASLKGKRVLVRVDYNVPLKNDEIQSTKRIDASMETIYFILKQNPKQLIIVSHLGRPKSKDDCSLKPLLPYLTEKLGQEVILVKDLKVNECDKIVILENIRHHKEETKHIETTSLFREKLTKLCDVFVNDAFGCCHRDHSSIVGITPPERYLGFLVQKEVKYLQDIFEKEGTKTLILGGSKVIDKIQLIVNLLPKFDNIIIGGGMAFTFLKKKNIKIGKSLFDEDGYNHIDNIIELANKYNTKLYFPTDCICNTEVSSNGNIISCLLENGIPDDYIGLDIGLKSISEFISVIDNTDIIVWNGPMGVFELSSFEIGSRELMEYISKQDNKITIIGGGDTTACCEKFKLEDKMTHVSTGGGASLELLEGKVLPGLTM